MLRFLLIACILLNCAFVKGQGIISTVAGTGVIGDSGDGGPATAAKITGTIHCIFDRHGNFYFSESYGSYKVRKIALDGTVTTIAGNGTNGDSGDGGQATLAMLEPNQLAIDSSGNLYICDATHSKIRRVNLTTGIISTFAGTGTSGYTGDGGQATNATFGGPSGICITPDGNIFVADNSYGTIRKVNASGIVSAYAGVAGLGVYSGDGGLATAAGMPGVFGLCLDSRGNIFVADGNIRRIDAVSHIISRHVGNGIGGFSGDEGPASLAAINSPISIVVDACDNVFVPDANNHRVRFVDSVGIIHTIAGNGSPGFNGDGGPATASQLYSAADVAFDSSGNLYICDALNYRIRKVSLNRCYNSSHLGIADYSNLPLALYPNPVTTELTIANVKEGGSYRLLNTMGTVTQQGVIKAGSNSIDMEWLPGGLYMLELSSEYGLKKVSRVVKE
jgi:hypothetical protein